MCLPPAVDSLAELLETLRTHPNAGQGPDAWIQGFGYDESKYPEGRGPTADDLEQVSATQPVFVQRCDGHSSVCNRRALELAGITEETTDPPGARYGRDADGRLNGLLIETNATDAVAAAIPTPDDEKQIRNLARLNRHFLERGIVGVADLLATMVPAPLRTFRAAEQQGLQVQCALYYGWPAIAENADPGPHRRRPDRPDQDRRPEAVHGRRLFEPHRVDRGPLPRLRRTRHAHPDRRGPPRGGELGAPQPHSGRRARDGRPSAEPRASTCSRDEEPWMGDLPSIRLDHATLFSPAMIERMNAARMSFAVVSHSIFLFAEYDSYDRNLSRASSRSPTRSGRSTNGCRSPRCPPTIPQPPGPTRTTCSSPSRPP